MEITNLSHIQSTQNVQKTQRVPADQNNTVGSVTAPKDSARKDSVSFSEESLRMSDLAKTNTESPKIRFDLVNRIRSEIAAGTYDTPEKMDIALERMASRVF
jgi:flagellar biosynthesis anti-sigma factor FlgM